MNFRFKAEQFEVDPGPSETVPLLMLRRSLNRWDVARRWAEDAARMAASKLDNPQLARCAAHLALEAEHLGELGARAVRAWAGDVAGPVFLQDIEGDTAILRADFGDAPRLVVVQAGDPDRPPGDRVFDLVVAECTLVRRAIEAMVPDPARRERCLKSLRAWRPNSLAGSLCTDTPGRIAWIIVESEIGKEAIEEEATSRRRRLGLSATPRG